MTRLSDQPNSSEFLIYQTDDGKTRIQVRLENETVWLSQKLMAELFQVSVPTINEHIRNIYDEGELQLSPAIRKFRIVQTEGSQQVDHAGIVSHEKAIEKARAENEKYRTLHINDPSPVERHFMEAVKEVKRLKKENGPRNIQKTRKRKKK